MLTGLLLICIVFQYIFIIYCIIFKNYNLVVASYIIHNFFYDYVFINASYYLPSLILNVLKPFNEYFFLFLLFGSVIKLFKTGLFKFTKLDKVTIKFFILPSILIFAYHNLLDVKNISNTIQGVRTYIIPVIIPYLLFRRGWLVKINFAFICYTIITLSIIAVLFGIYQKFTFRGDIKSLWFAEFFAKMNDDPVGNAPFDFIRNEVLRTTSFFVSPIIYSFVVATAIIVSVCMFFSKIVKFSKIILSIIIILLFYGLIISETRVGLINFFIGIILIYYGSFSKKKYTFFIMIIVPIIWIIFTFITLIYGFTDELSALGRLTQYASFFEYFKINGLGFSDENVLTRWDTFYMSLTFLFGIFVIFPLLFIYKINSYLFNKYQTISEESKYFALAVLVISLTFIYSFAFQFTAGSYPYKLIFLLIFIVLPHSNHILYDNKKANSNCIV